MKRIKYIGVMIMILTLMIGVPVQEVFAESVSFSVGVETISFDTGNGVHGDVHLKADGIYKNGTRVSTANNGNITIETKHLETLGANKNYIAYDMHSVMTAIGAGTYNPTTVNFGTLSGSAPVITGIPNFKSLTIDEGIVLTSTQGTNLIFKVQETIVNNGAIFTRHGSGGVGGGAGSNGGVNSSPYIGSDGGHATSGTPAGNILIFADSLENSPNGTTATTGLILAGSGGSGGGGGGGGAGGKSGPSWDIRVYAGGKGGNAGHGANGGTIALYTNILVNKSEIKAGNGGSGGGAGAGGKGALGYDSESGNQELGYASDGSAGNRGFGGEIKVYAWSLDNNVIASGVDGDNGEAAPNNGNNQAGAGGNSAGSGGSGGYREYYEAGGDNVSPVSGGNGLPGGVAKSPRTTSKNIIVYADTVTILGKLIAGYDAVNPIGQSGITTHFNSVITPVDLPTTYRNNATRTLKILGTSTPSINGGTGFHLHSAEFSNNVDLTVSGNITFVDNINLKSININGATVNGTAKTILTQEHINIINSTLNNLSLDGNDININNSTLTTSIANITARNNLNLNSGQLTAGRINVINNLETQANSRLVSVNSANTVSGNLHIRGDLGNITFRVTGDTRFLENPVYRSDTAFWSSRTINVNGMRIHRATPTAQPNAVGMLEVKLDSWFSNYGSIDMEFKVAKKVSTDTTFKYYNPVTRTLANTSMWSDPSTIIGKDIQYIVGYRLAPTATGYVANTGFLYIEPMVTVGRSEGGGIDEIPPTVLHFEINNGDKVGANTLVDGRIMAHDNRTQEKNLELKFKIGNLWYLIPKESTEDVLVQYDAGSHSSQWGRMPNNQTFSGIPLLGSPKSIEVYVKDEVTLENILVYVVKYDSAQALPDGTIKAPAPPDITKPEDVAAFEEKFKVEIQTPTGTEKVPLINYDGRWTFVSKKPLIYLDLNHTDNAAYHSFSLDGSLFSETHKKETKMEILLPKNDLNLVKIRPANVSLSAGTPTTYYFLVDKDVPTGTIDTANRMQTAAKTGTLLQLKANVKDNITESPNLEYRIKGGTTWTKLGEGIISVTVMKGLNTIEIEVRDQALNITTISLGKSLFGL